MSVKNRISSLSKAAQETADKMNEVLPVKLTALDVEKTPSFVKLLDAIAHHISVVGLSRSVQQDLQEAEALLKVEKSKWLENQILYTELQELLMDFYIESQEQKTTASDTQFYEAVQEVLSLAEIGDYLECDPEPSSSTTLLGITQEDVDRHNPHKKHLSAIQQRLIPEVECRLMKKCEHLVNLQESNNTTASEKLNFAKASQLPALIEAEKRNIEQLSSYLRRDRNNREKQFWQLYQALLDSLEILEELIVKHRLKSQTKSDEITSEWLASRCDGLCLKIRLVELQFLRDTYQTEVVQALNSISHELDTVLHDSQSELGQLSQALATYEAVGVDFDNIVQEYSALKSDFENMKWALKEFQHSADDEQLSH